MTVAFDVEASALARRSTCPECGRHAIHGTGCSRGGVDVVTMLQRARTRAKTVSVKRLSKRALEIGTMLYPREESDSYDRPVTRADCLPGGCNEQRPCPWVSCVWHLALDVNPDTGSIKHNFPDREVWEMPETCTLDVADREGQTLESVGETIGLTRERVRQIETRATDTLRRLGAKVLESPDDRPEYLPMVRVRRSIPRCEDHRTSREPLPEARPWSRDDHSRIFNRAPYNKRDER